MVRALWEYGLYEQTDGAECMDTPLREHIPKERCFLSDKVQQGGGLPELFGTNCFPSWGEGEGGKENTATAPAVLKMQQLRGAFKNYLADFVRWGGGVPLNSAKEFGPILTLFYEEKKT